MSIAEPERADPISRPRRAIVHIGTHKTGTTSFQAWARRYRRELAEKTGLHYYDGRFKRNHFELAVLSVRPDRIPPNRRLAVASLDQAQLREYICQQVKRPGRDLLCSAEDLSYARHTDEVERLVELLRPREVSVIVVLRDPADFLRSYAAEFTRQGVEPSRDANSITYVAPDSWLVRYDDLLEVYRNVLGEDRVHVVDYEESLQRDGSIIPAVLRACGAETAGLPAWEGLWQHRSRGSNIERSRAKKWWRDQRRRGD
jgi:hypothetical protein